MFIVLFPFGLQIYVFFEFLSIIYSKKYTNKAVFYSNK